MAVQTPRSPFAPAQPATVPEVKGVAMAAAEAGIKYRGRKDLLLIALSDNTTAVGVTTKSRTCSAPVLWCRAQLEHGTARALVVNSGNANAFTGRRGEDAVQTTVDAAASALGCQAEHVFAASTGVIGEPLDVSAFSSLLGQLAGNLTASGWHEAAAAIMTTDTYPKAAGCMLDLGGQQTAISGIAKGSGMIAPDMGTMLSFVFTDAAFDQALLHQVMRECVDQTFNCITVDGDTSTSDTLLVFATGASGAPPVTERADPRFAPFRDGLLSVMHDLAMQVVKDGEGISKFVTLKISGADHTVAARKIGRAIANSPLVKTAIAGGDANWGRIVMAVGKAGESADRDKLSIHFGPHLVAKDGERAPSYSEDQVAAYMKNTEIEISVDVGVGSGTATVWTCDLTHGYISINADYRS